MLRVGLTGGIACGKSAVLRRLSEAGFQTLDLDSVVHELLMPGGRAYGPVVEAFGAEFVQKAGTIDRKALGTFVFADEAQRRRLNAIVHPLVRVEEARRAALGAETAGVFVTDAALLVESGGHLRFDRLVVVYCPVEEQLRRLRARDGLSEADARARIESQMPLDEKRGYAHIEINTSGPSEETALRAGELAETLRQMAAEPSTRVELPIERALGGIVWGPSAGPGGLSPLDLLEEIGAVGGLEMEGLLARLSPPRARPWYRAGRSDPPGPENLAVAVVLFALARSGFDPDFLVSAMSSLACLTHGRGEEASGACLVSLLLNHVACGRGLGPELEENLAGWRALAKRWGGAEPPPRFADVIPRLRARAQDPQPGDVLGGAIGLLRGVPLSSAPARAQGALRRIGALDLGGPRLG
jgi:dephospho-CoA kinase